MFFHSTQKDMKKAKTTFTTKFGKPSEVTNRHIHLCHYQVLHRAVLEKSLTSMINW